MSRGYRIAAVVFTVLTVGMAHWCTRLPWAPRIDFDIVGVLWLLQNMAPLMLVLLTLLCGGLALYCWVRGALGR